MKSVIANFKSNKNAEEMKSWVESFQKNLTSLSSQLSTRIVLCPPTPFLSTFELLVSDQVQLGVQDISPYPAGAYTGALSTYNLQGIPVTYAIVGHSERRRYFHENAQDIAKKVQECLAASITPIVCVTKDQINTTANALSEAERAKCIVAFEPIEHIGTGESDTLEHILETKQWISIAFGNVPYIYGGSVNEHTDKTIVQHPEIDGFLVGSACLDAMKFGELLSHFKS